MGHVSQEDLPLDRVALLVAGREFASTARVHRACYDHRRFADANVLRVLYADAPVEPFEWTSEYGTRPNFGAIVVANQPDAVEGADPPRDDVVAMKSNRNLDAVGSAVTAAVEKMSDGDHRVHVCFTWVDTLVDVAGEQFAFQFLRLLIEMIEETEDCGAHFHFDPGETSKEQRLTMEQLFDAVVDIEERFDRARTTTSASSHHENL